jgi:protocatechuate 3,4-dioxygenase beta subunit
MPITYAPLDWSAQPIPNYDGYRSTALRTPNMERVRLPQSLSEITGPGGFAPEVDPSDSDLTTNGASDGEAIGERIIVTGHVIDERSNPIPNTLVEIWQTNSAGRYRHRNDQHHAPLDPNFLGAGRCLTDENGAYRFLTVRPGAYPWKNHPNAWRPPHIHYSIFGPSLLTRLVTQMYFPGDPLHALDPILTSIADAAARASLVAAYDHDVTEEEWALGYRFDVVVRAADRSDTNA